MYRSCPDKLDIFNSGIFQFENNSGIFLALELIPVFLIGVFFQPENNSSIFSPRKINTVFIFALDSGWTAAGQSKWTEWTEVCPLDRKKVQ